MPRTRTQHVYLCAICAGTVLLLVYPPGPLPLRKTGNGWRRSMKGVKVWTTNLSAAVFSSNISTVFLLPWMYSLSSRSFVVARTLLALLSCYEKGSVCHNHFELTLAWSTVWLACVHVGTHWYPQAKLLWRLALAGQATCKCWNVELHHSYQHSFLPLGLSTLVFT